MAERLSPPIFPSGLRPVADDSGPWSSWVSAADIDAFASDRVWPRQLAYSHSNECESEEGWYFGGANEQPERGSGRVGRESEKNAGVLVGLGVLTVIAGFLAIGSPMVSGMGVSILIGIALVIAGVARTFGAFSAGSFGQGALAFFGGILTSLPAGSHGPARPGSGDSHPAPRRLPGRGRDFGRRARFPRPAGEGMALDALQRRHRHPPRVPPAAGVAAVRGVGDRDARWSQPSLQWFPFISVGWPHGAWPTGGGLRCPDLTAARRPS